MSETLEREYIRHPANIPIKVMSRQSPKQLNFELNNVSEGGLSFRSPKPYSIGSIVTIKIDSLKPVFKVMGVVQWCRMATGSSYEMGVKFLDQQDAYRVRMVEQICHIEEYRQQQAQESGRRMTKNEASFEWIEQFGSDFP